MSCCARSWFFFPIFSMCSNLLSSFDCFSALNLEYLLPHPLNIVCGTSDEKCFIIVHLKQKLDLCSPVMHRTLFEVCVARQSNTREHYHFFSWAALKKNLNRYTGCCIGFRKGRAKTPYGETYAPVGQTDPAGYRLEYSTCKQ
jgi:hypothetical protein